MLFIWLAPVIVIGLGVVVIKQRMFIIEQDDIIIDLCEVVEGMIAHCGEYIEADYQKAINEQFEEISERYYNM